MAVGGDTTFGLDELAERAAQEFFETAAGTGLGWYTEDRGLTVRGTPKTLIVLDPIDGSRPAGAGLESCVVAVAEAPFSEQATIGDVTRGLVLEIGSGTMFTAAKGKGTRIVKGGEAKLPSPAPTTSLEDAFWTYGLRGRPTMPSAVVLEELIDRTGVRSGTFDLGSAAFAMTRVVTGQLDAYVDHGHRLIEEVPETRRLFEEIASGAVLNNSPYDVAAAALICTEAGCLVTDAAGRPLEDRPLVGSGPDFQLSAVAACTRELHGALIEALDRGFERLRDTFSRDTTVGS